MCTSTGRMRMSTMKMPITRIKKLKTNTRWSNWGDQWKEVSGCQLSERSGEQLVSIMNAGGWSLQKGAFGNKGDSKGWLGSLKIWVILRKR